MKDACQGLTIAPTIQALENLCTWQDERIRNLEKQLEDKAPKEQAMRGQAIDRWVMGTGWLERAAALGRLVGYRMYDEAAELTEEYYGQSIRFRKKSAQLFDRSNSYFA